MRGLREHPKELMDGFRHVVNDCGLVDFKLEGYPLTWVKSKGRPNCIKDSLDRAWLQAFPNATL